MKFRETISSESCPKPKKVAEGHDVNRYISILLASAFLAMPSWAQDEDTESEETEESQVEAEEVDDSDLDEQGFTDEDNDFRPSEDIPADQSIPFPTDI